MSNKNLICILIFFSSFLNLFSQENNLEYIQNLTISDGLAHNGVTSMLEDSRGFLWVGTYDGLNRYDGYDLKIYKNTIDKDILVSNRVRTIAEDENNNLWIGTDEGITIYNYATESFKNLYSNKDQSKNESGPTVRNILINSETGKIVCATEEGGILVFKDDQTFLGKYMLSSEGAKSNILFFNGLMLDNNNYLFATSVGLVLFNLQKEQFKRVLKDEVKYSNAILRIDEDSILITQEHGITVLEIEPNKKSFKFKINHSDLLNYKFNSLMVDTIGNLWLGDLIEGLFHIDNIQKVKEHKPFNMARFMLKSGVLRASSIVSVTNNMCWFGTFNEGLYKFGINENPFKKYHVELDYKNAISSNHIGHISALDGDRVFLGSNRTIGSNRGGIALFNTKTDEFEPIPFQIPEEDKRNVGSVFVDSKKNIWLRIEGKGLYRKKEGSIVLNKVFAKNIPRFKNLAPRSFSEDRLGNIWIGCLDDVYKITVNKSNEIEKVESLNNNPFFSENPLKLVRRVYTDPLHDFIWLGADSDGLFKILLEKNKNLSELKIHQYIRDVHNKFSISSNFVTSMVRLPNEEMWIGTEGGGICKVVNSDSDNPEFIAFTEKNGLSNNVVKSILYDEEYNLWVSTNVGLNKFDTKDSRFRRFGISDGLPFEDFWFAAEKINNGYFLLSGLDGFCYFNPENLSVKEELPRLEIGDVKIFNKSIFPGDTIDKRVLFKKRLQDQDEITLKYDENVFSIEFISLHFLNPDNHSLKYRLLPINQDWIEVPSNQNIASYNGLQPGEYSLNIMASNSLNKWTEPIELKITISPPYWKTPLAYFIYLIITGILIYIVVHFVLRIQSLNHNLEIEQLEKDKVNEVNAAKLRFFSNISHEIKTPLTLISGPVSILAERFKNNFDVKEKLDLVQRQSRKILQLVDQVHDFQRADANLLKMNFSRFCFDTFMAELTEDFEFMAKNEQKKLIIEGGEKKIYVSADKDKLEKIFNNLLSNAFKFTKINDTIIIKYYKEGKNIIVSVSDTGKGIDSDDLSHVFERFYQSIKKHGEYTGGSGIGLAFSKRLVEMHYGYINAESEVGQGTTVTVKLPIVKKIPENLLEEYSEKENPAIFVKQKEELHNNSLIKKVNPSSIDVSSEFADSLVFLAEDNVEMRLFVEDVLSNFFKVKTFTNGKECLDALENEWPDIIVSDLLMPELNGLELCKIVKSDIKTSHIPIILLTALTTIDHQIQGINEGADAYIKKPFCIQHLVTNTESLLRNRQKLRERYKIDFPLTLEKSKDNTKDNIFLEKLYSLMADNLDNQNLDLDRFSKELYLNRTHFYQKVKALTYLTPFELLKNYRLKKAAEFLVQKKLSINEVYVMTGFKSRTHFSKLFKEKYNCTPGKYATEAKKKILKK